MQRLSAEMLLCPEAFGTGLFLTEVELVDGKELRVDIPLDARVAVDARGRALLSEPHNPRWRWAAGGALCILRLRDVTVVPLSVSDPIRSALPNHLKASTGISGSTEEWIRPIRLMREAFEAIAVVTPMGLAIPQFGDPELDALAYGVVPSVLHLIEAEHDLPGIFYSGLIDTAAAQLLPLQGEKDIVVSVGGSKRSVTRALPVLDPLTRGIDLIHAFEIDLRSHLLDEIAVLYVEEVDGRAANAEMALVELGPDRRPLRIVRSYRSGRPADGVADLGKLSPVLGVALAAL